MGKREKGGESIYKMYCESKTDKQSYNVQTH